MIRHLIVFNIAAGATHEQCLAMAEKGRLELSRIPGVVGVSYGMAVNEAARYKYYLAVDFTGREIIKSYQEHPVHTAFADQDFRPLAVERITTDYDLLF